jgi:HK97 family phage major capsid protein
VLSIEVLEDASNIDQIVSDSLGKVLALELDRACLRGSGTPPELKGIRFQTGVNIDSTTFTTDGSVISNAAPTGAVAHIWLAKMIAAMWAVNESPSAVIWHPRTGGEMDQLVDSTGQPLRELPSESRLLKLQTAAIPINLTQGTSVDASEATLGDFRAAMIGLRTSLVVEVSRIGNVGATSLFTTMQAGIRAYLRADFQLARPAAFRVVAGIR